jgi:hypothetical protein
MVKVRGYSIEMGAVQKVPPRAPHLETHWWKMMKFIILDDLK